jgi:hypothetical protein
MTSATHLAATVGHRCQDQSDSLKPGGQHRLRKRQVQRAETQGTGASTECWIPEKVMACAWASHRAGVSQGPNHGPTEVWQWKSVRFSGTPPQRYHPIEPLWNLRTHLFCIHDFHTCPLDPTHHMRHCWATTTTLSRAMCAVAVHCFEKQVGFRSPPSRDVPQQTPPLRATVRRPSGRP